MEAQIEQLGQVLMITLCAFTLFIVAMLVYLLWLCLQLHRDVRRYFRRPKVERDPRLKTRERL